MRGDEVDAVGRLVVTILVKICTSRDTSCNFTNDSRFAFDEVTDAVSVFAIPFGPSCTGKSSDLIQASCIPGFSDDFGLAEKIVEFDRPDHRRVFERCAVFPSAQD